MIRQNVRRLFESQQQRIASLSAELTRETLADQCLTVSKSGFVTPLNSRIVRQHHKPSRLRRVCGRFVFDDPFECDERSASHIGRQLFPEETSRGNDVVRVAQPLRNEITKTSAHRPRSTTRRRAPRPPSPRRHDHEVSLPVIRETAF